MTLMGREGLPGGQAGPPAVKPVPGLPATSEWPVKAAGALESLVGTVRTRVVRPLQSVAKILVFAVLAGLVGLALAVLFAVLVVRLLDVYAFGGRVWASDLVVGGIFAAAGLLLSSRKRSKARS